ncbi:hypothetical protein [Natronorubrum halophilum]|uniref:hypothetical protein n=1 Tax=Natronorubrum halophilum TaxID=1702106 RepID=UPI0030B84517
MEREAATTGLTVVIEAAGSYDAAYFVPCDVREKHVPDAGIDRLSDECRLVDREGDQ